MFLISKQKNKFQAKNLLKISNCQAIIVFKVRGGQKGIYNRLKFFRK